MAAVWLVVAVLPLAAAKERGVRTTVHNLSASGPGEIRALDETEVCKFCHIPHNAVVPDPLWGHALSSARYDVPEVRSREGEKTAAPQPDGSSRLCLSCHDGTVALGDIGGEPRPIRMVGTQRLRTGHRGFLGTDLTGSHPISFVVPDGDPPGDAAPGDIGLKPLAAIRSDPDVRLDTRGKMQCTTCHDPHSDANFEEGRVPRFWVKPTLEEVCLTCHDLR
jgi:hypothetical protein